MSQTCTSCGQPFPLYTLPDYDEDRDMVNVCDPCREMSRLRFAREQFARSGDLPVSAWVMRALGGYLPAKDFTY